MTAVICFPNNDGGYQFAKIYRTSGEEYTLIDTVNALQYEYEDEDGDYASCYKVAFSDGVTDQPQVSVKSLMQQIITIVRSELHIQESLFSDLDIYVLFDTAKTEIMSDICTYYSDTQISKLTEKIYQLPNKYFFDINFGGVTSPLDFEFFKQVAPIYIYSEKIPVTVSYVNPEEQYVELIEPIASNEILKVNYYSIGRTVKHKILLNLIAYKIVSMLYDNYSTGSSVAQNSRIKIGDISIQTGTSSSYYADLAMKWNAKYNQSMKNLKTGFVRSN